MRRGVFVVLSHWASFLDMNVVGSDMRGRVAVMMSSKGNENDAVDRQSWRGHFSVTVCDDDDEEENNNGRDESDGERKGE